MEALLSSIIGGLILPHMMTLSGVVQKAVLCASYVVNVLTSWGSV